MSDAIRGTLRDSVGRPIAGALIKVFNGATDTLAAIFSDEDLLNAITNDGATSPLSEADGSYGPFYVGNQKIDLDIVKTGYTFDVTDMGNIIAYDEGKLRATSSNDTLTLKDRILVVDATGGARTIGISALSNFDIGRSFTVIKKDGTSNAVIIDPNASETINGQLTIELNMRGQGITFRKISSTEWFADAYGDQWITPAYSAGDFTGQSSMIWTVEAGDVITYEYMIRGKTMTVLFEINTSSVSGTPSISLQIKIPAGKVAAKTAWAVTQILDNSTAAFGHVTTSAGGTNLLCRRDAAGSVWTASTNNTYVRGQITFEIQ